MKPAIDLHVDTLLRIVEKGGDFCHERPDLHVDPVRARAGGVRMLLLACFTREDHPAPAENVAAMLERAAQLDADPECPLGQLRCAADYEALDDAAVGFLLTIENGLSLEGDLERLDAWHAAGVCILGLTWNATNDLASGCTAEPGGGLTELGRQVVRRVASLGMAIDLSHLAPPGVVEVLAEDVPLLATHSNAAALHPHPRNLDDEQLRGIAERGGIVGLNFYAPFLADGEANLSTVARHARHMADVMGAEHVAIGTDLDGIDRLPGGFAGHQDLPRLEEALLGHGFDDAERQGIFGGNFLRWWRRL